MRVVVLGSRGMLGRDLMAACRQVFDSNQRKEAKALIVEAKEIEDICDDRVRTLVRGGSPNEMAPAYVLAYRYFKRVASHFRNVTSSVVQPVHKLDFTSKITEAEPSAEAERDRSSGFSPQA